MKRDCGNGMNSRTLRPSEKAEQETRTADKAGRSVWYRTRAVPAATHAIDLGDGASTATTREWSREEEKVRLRTTREAGGVPADPSERVVPVRATCPVFDDWSIRPWPGP